MQTFKKTTVAAAIVLSMSAFAAQADETATSTPTNPTLAEFQKGFSGQTFTDGAFTIANIAAVDPGAQYVNNTRTAAPDDGYVYGGVFYTYSKDNEFVLKFDEAVFSGNKVINTGNGGISAGGAAFLKGTSSTHSHTFVDTLFVNNQAVAQNDKVMAGGGALYLDATKNTGINRASTATIVTTHDMTYVGNAVTSNDNGRWYELWGSLGQSGGGFAYLDRKSELTFDVQGGTLTIGAAGAADASVDSIQSSIVANNGDASSIVKTGEGALVINSDFSQFYGKLDVRAGSVTIARDVKIWNDWTVSDGELHLADVELGQIQTGSFGTFVQAGGDSKEIAFEVKSGSVGKLTIKGGAVTADSITISGSGVADFKDKGTHAKSGYGIDISGGSLATETLTLGKGGHVAISGTGLVSIGTLATTEADNGAFSMSGGTLDLTAEQVFGVNEETQALNTTMKDVFSVTGGTLDFSDESFDTKWLDAVTNGKNFVIVAGTVMDEDGSTLDAVGIDDLKKNVVYGSATLETTPVDGTVSIGVSNSGVQNISSGEPISSVAITENFTLVGNGSALVTNTAENGATISVAKGKTLTLGSASSTGGSLNGSISASEATVSVMGGHFEITDELVANELTVETGAALVADTVAAAKTGTVRGSVSATTLDGKGTFTVKENGVVEANAIKANVTLETGAQLVIGEMIQTEAEAVATASTLARIAPCTTELVDVPQIGSVVSIAGTEHDVVVTTNKNGEALLQAAAGSKYDAQENIGLYVDSTIHVDETSGVLNIGADAAHNSSTGTIAVGANGVVVVDVASLNGDAAFDAKNGVVFNSDAKLILSGMTTTGNYLMSTAGLGMQDAEVTTTNGWLTGSMSTIEGEGGNWFVAEFNRSFADEDVSAIVEQFVQPGSESARVMAQFGDVNGRFVGEDGKLTDEGEELIYEYISTPVVAGTYNVSYDAAEQVTGAIERRNLEPSTGLGVWADVFYSANEAKNIYGGAGYDADIYGGVIGFDWTASCGAKLGAAVSVGTGDADSVGTLGKYSNDADFWGLTVYTGKDIGGLYFSADVSYISLDNDISGTYNMGTENVDSSVFTVGLRADMTVYESAGKGFKIVPHVGVRYSNIDVDDYRDIKADSMDVFETPIGVKFAGDFATASGWTVTPNFDFTIVPQLGDKDVNTLDGKVDILDSVYNSTLGVNASCGNFMFGLSYRYGFGNDDRSNNAFQARASYAF